MGRKHRRGNSGAGRRRPRVSFWSVASWAFLELGCAGAARDGAGMGIFVARNAMPWGWPALFRLDEIVDRAAEDSPLFAAAPVVAVRERAARLGARDARFGAFGQLAERLS